MSAHLRVRRDGDGVTFSRRRTFKRGENVALAQGAHLRQSHRRKPRMKTTTAEFATVLAEWRSHHSLTDAEAAAAMGCSYGAFRGCLTR